MTVRNSSADTMIAQSIKMKKSGELASAGPPWIEKSDRILRWKSREEASPTEENLDGHQGNIDNAACAHAHRSSSQQGQAGPRPSWSPSRSWRPGPTYARPESPSRWRGESVRRRASIDFDALRLSRDTSANRLQSGTSTVPSFDELLNQRTETTCRSNHSPARSDAVDGEDSSRHTSMILFTGIGPDEEMKSKQVTRMSNEPEETSQIIGTVTLPEFPSSVEPLLMTDLEASSRPAAAAAAGDLLPRNSEIVPDTSSSYENTDLMDMAQVLAGVSAARSSEGSFLFSTLPSKVKSMVPSSRNVYENEYFSPKSEKHRNQTLQGAEPGGSSSLRSSPRVLEFSGTLPMFEALQGNASPQVREKGHESPQVRARNAFLQRLHVERSGQGRSDLAFMQMPTRQSRIGAGLRRGEPLSQSARYVGQQIPDFGSPRSSTSMRTTSSFPNQSLRKVLDSTARSSGLSISCRRLSLDYDVLDSSSYHGSNVVSLLCRPSPLRPRTTASGDKLNSSSRDVQDNEDHDQRVPKTVESTQSVAASTRTSVLTSWGPPRGQPASPAKSFKKWVASQFHFGGGSSKKSKDGLKPSSSSSPAGDSDKLSQHQLSAGGHGKGSPRRLKLPAEYQAQLGSVPRMTYAAEPSAAAHPLPEPPEGPLDSSSENGSDGFAVHRPRQTSDMYSDHSVDKNVKEELPGRHDKNTSRRLGRHPSINLKSSVNPSGPLKFQGLQHLFATEVSSPRHVQQASAVDSPQKGSDGKPKRTMKFLECAEIADLNEFLRAQRDSVTSCQKNGGGYLKFISTLHPTDIGSMISAICLSYFLEKRRNGPGKWRVVPLINFSRWKMKDHLDAAWLFNVCGLDVKALMFMSEVDTEGLSKAGVTTSMIFVGEQVLRKTNEVGSCCTLLAETFLRHAEELWARSGSFLKTLLLAGLLMDTDNLSKSSSSATTSRDHQMLVNLATGAGPLGRFGLFERMRTVQTDPEVLKMAIKHYGQEQCTDSSPRSLPPPTAENPKGAKLLSPKGSPLFSSEADDHSRSSGSPTSRSSSSERSRSNSPATNLPPPPETSQPRKLSSLSRLPTAADATLRMPSSRKSGLAY